MHKFFVDPSSVGEDSIKICGDDAHHISKVLRLKEDDDVIVCDKCGQDFYCSIKSISKDEVICQILKKEVSLTEPPIHITLYQGVPKGDKLDTVIQKCAELGCVRIVPVAMKRSVAVIKDREKKQQRGQRIAYEAAKQCARAKIPEVAEVMTFKEAMDDSASLELKILPYESETQNGLKALLKESSGVKSIAVFIGPEGGFDPDEVTQAEANGFKTVTLGPRILRTETAPLACISAIMYELGDW